MIKTLVVDSMKLIKYFLSGLLLVFIFFSFRYISNINLAGSFNIINAVDSAKIIAVTPLGREVSKSHDFKGFYKEIRIENSDNTPIIIQELNDVETYVNVVKKNDSYISNHNELSFYERIMVLFVISLKHILFLLIVIFLSYYIIKSAKQLLKKNGIKQLIIKIYKLKSIIDFIRTEHLRILIPVVIGFIPGLIYLYLKPELLVFFNTTYINTFLFFGLLFSPQIFLIYYSKKLKLNLYFFLSFFIIFIIYYLILCPEYYIYGKLFRDDISKFFVKANTNNLFEALTALNANYLNTYQTFTVYFILRVLGIKNYFPEFFQLSVLFTIVFIYASFNLKVFKAVCKDEILRFIISLLCAFIGAFCGYILFLYDVPFLVALLFWAVIFINMEHLSTRARFIILLFFTLFILSKPIFIIYLPLLTFLMIYALYYKRRHTFIVTLIWIIALVFHFVIYFNTDNILFSQHSADGLGVEQSSDFRYESMAFTSVIKSGIFVYVRLLTRIFYPFEVAHVQIRLLINIILIIFQILINVWLIYNYFKSYKKIYLFFLTANIIALTACFIFVKTVSADMLYEQGRYILDYKIMEYLFSAYIPPAHRYLILGYVTVLASALFFITYLVKRKSGISERILLLVFGIYFISISVFFYRNVIFSEKKFNAKHSLWRQYSDMIYDYPDNYYLPYYDYPKQNESIKSGINRITDVYVSNTGTVLLDDVHSKGSQWDIIQIITEYEPLICPEIKKLICVTNNNDTLLFEPLKPVNEKYRFIIFRFDDFLMLKEFKFVDKNYAPLQLKNFIRLVGKYE